MKSQSVRRLAKMFITKLTDWLLYVNTPSTTHKTRGSADSAALVEFIMRVRPVGGDGTEQRVWVAEQCTNKLWRRITLTYQPGIQSSGGRHGRGGHICGCHGSLCGCPICIQ